ncbi:MAG: PDDEXK nuclease domain-containing protein [Armatimonadetes bacterium]|nr:PDDEXK nuclease domain-containing protein [Armatimonadota bacterium]
MIDKLSKLPKGYEDLLHSIRQRIQGAQLRAGFAVNRELVLLYWQIGCDILTQQKQQGWGTGVIDRLSMDLRESFPDMKGFSARNLGYMRSFAMAWPDEQFVQEVPAKLPWYHSTTLLEKVKNEHEREWYAREAVEYGWSRNVMVHQIETHLYHRQGKAISNFHTALPPPMSDLAQAILKDPYNFDFLTLGREFSERELERGLLDHLRSFLLELGAGFALVGSQYHLEVDNQDFYIDLLFYHLRLRCFVVIELKACEFQPEFVGKLNFYLSAVDDLLKQPDDKPTIGMILCRNKGQVIVEYALRDLAKPVGVSEYHFAAGLPEHLRGVLPSIEDLERELSREQGLEAE